MGLFDKLVSKLTGNPTPSPHPAGPQEVGRPEPVSPAPSQRPAFSMSVTFSGPTGPTVQVSDSEVAQAASQYVFVLTNELQPLKTADQWWEEATHKRRVREGSEKAYEWFLPFVPLEIAKREQLRKAQEWGPHSANTVAKELRALIRERRKAKQPQADLLLALYGACVLADLSASLKFEGMQPHAMARYVDINELQAIRCDYSVMGYQCGDSLSKTDLKWLIEAFGEPAEHQSFDALWPHIRRNAISRYCWSELRRSNDAAKSLGWPQKTMQGWLDELVKRNLGYQKEWQERVAARNVLLAELASVLDAAWAATTQRFVVADLETTGLNAATDEVLEFAASQVDPSGAVTAEFSTLVRVTGPVPDVITKLTGITQADVDREGQPLAEAMRAFLAFVGSCPVFFHNAPFDQGFMKTAGAQARLKFANPVHDTLPLARAAWPSLGTYKLTALAEHIGATAPVHRALEDTRAALAVLLAARDLLSNPQGAVGPWPITPDQEVRR